MDTLLSFVERLSVICIECVYKELSFNCCEVCHSFGVSFIG